MAAKRRGPAYHAKHAARAMQVLHDLHSAGTSLSPADFKRCDDYSKDVFGATVTLNAGEEGDDALRKELVAEVRKEIGGMAAPEKIQFAPALPKTRSGKIMRRILRKIAEGETTGLGDTSTLADPGVVDALVANRR